MMKSTPSHFKKILIIGAKGAMGRFFQNRLEGRGYQVEGLDRPLDESSLRCGLEGSTLVLLAVPIKAMESVLDELRDLLTEGTILADICSVKVRPLDLMLRASSGPVIGLHPLFGPEPDGQQPLKVALVPGRGTEALNLVDGLLRSIDFCPFQTTAEEHDQAMAAIQGLNFVTTISYLSAVSESPGVDQFLTPSFSRRLQAARKMLTQDCELFQTLFEANPFSQEAVRCFRSYLNLAAAGELDLLSSKASWWWCTENGKRGS